MKRDAKKIAFGLLVAVAGYASGLGKTVRVAPLNASSSGSDDVEVAAVACSSEKLAIQRGEDVVLRAWSQSLPGRKLNYRWRVPVGSVAGSGREVAWSLKGIEAGIYTAEVTVSDDSGLPATCSVRVAIVEPERGEEVTRETTRGFLVKGTKEADEYGLYSYLLLGSPPTKSTRERYVKTLEAYMRFVDQSKFEEDAYPKSKLNITYLPLEQAGKENADVAWLLEHYDYARARILLDTLPGERRSGIYFVSCSKPLTGGPNSPYLIQDLSALPVTHDDLIGWWVDEFLRQAAQEHFWETSTVRRLALNMRTTVAVLAEGLPDVQKSLNSWIAWVH